MVACESNSTCEPGWVAEFAKLHARLDAIEAATRSAPPKQLLSLNEVAERLGIGQQTLRDWCNHIDKKTGKHSPKIEHTRIGSRGRRNPSVNEKGAIKFTPASVERFIEQQTSKPLPVAMADSTPKRNKPYRSIYF